ncbi:MAG: aldo/keto reductase [Anaerolineae bacterium]|nr:aldo/keto reductase [Anaerolineae bacterium]
MEKRQIGSLSVSVVGLGCNNFGRRIDAAQSATVINAALEKGINFLDTADIYGNGQSEDFIRQALGSRRKDVIIASKFGNLMEGQGRGAHPDYIRTAVETSLQRLGTDYIDLYQLHVPDPDVPIADTLGALNELVQAGKVREIGSSNFSAEQIRDSEAAVKAGAARFVSVQNEYSLLKREAENGVLAACAELGIGFLPYFPLASGLLTGKYRQGQPSPEGTRLSGNATWLSEQNLVTVEKLISFAEAKGHTILELAFGWLLAKPVVTSVIAGATRVEQIEANAAAASWTLSEAELAEIDQLLA